MFQPSDTTGTDDDKSSQSGTESQTSGTQGGDDGQQQDADDGSSTSGADDKSPKKDESQNQTQSQVSKESRHFSRKINQEIEKRVDLAKDILVDNPDYIYRLAERDPDAADRILKEDPQTFGGAKSSKELLQKKKLDDGGDDGVKETVLQQQDRIERVERTQKESRIRELKRVHPDLEGELEDEFLKMDGNTYFDRFSDDAKVDMARAALGVQPPDTSDADSVARDMLTQREGSTISRRSAPQGRGKQSQETPEETRTRQIFGNTAEDEEKYLSPEERAYIDSEFA